MAKVEKTLKKISVEKIDLAKQKPGFSFEGKFMGAVAGSPFKAVDQKTGEVIEKTLTNAIFEDEKGNRFSVIQDAGLKAALADSMVTQGMFIRVEKREKASLKGGRTMNAYDIYTTA